MELIIAANWKMHKTAPEAAVFCGAIREDEESLRGVEVVICPPFTALHAARVSLEGSEIKLGAQNMFHEAKGAFTGEIAAPMLVDMNVSHVIIGHSERRHIMGEDDVLIRKKFTAALEHGLVPILCVGETGKERDQGAADAVIERQVRSALEGIKGDAARKLVIAYEPVWAIGTGKAASPEDADCAARLIREVALRSLGAAAAGRLRIQYGGSVNAENIGAFTALPLIHGALVGGASLDVSSFIDLILKAREAAES